MTPALFQDVPPWRTFRWHYGQRHYSGSYWASTTSAHVIYESRLELARLLVADFDRTVNHIVAQPFMLRTALGGRICRHIPDYLLLTEGGPVVVESKPADLLDDPVVAETFGWVRNVVESLGWSLKSQVAAGRRYPLLRGETGCGRRPFVCVQPVRHCSSSVTATLSLWLGIE